MQLLVNAQGVRIAYLEKRQQQLRRVCEIQSRLAQADFNLDDFMQTVVDLLHDLTGSGGVVIELVEGDEMVYRAADAGHAKHLGLRLRRSGSLSGLCVEQQEVLHCADAEADPRVDRDACRAVGVRSMICAPLLEEGLPVGVLKAFDPRPGAFSEDDIDTLRLLAGMLGSALGVRLAFHHRQALLDERVETLAMLSQARDAALEKARRADMAETIAGLGHWRYDVLAKESSWSATMCDLHAVPRGQAPSAEAVGAMIHPDDRARVGRHIRDCLEQGAGCERVVFQLCRADGVWRYLEASIAAELDPAGAPIALVGVLRDVTAEKARELELHDARRAAESAARVKADFLANMTHELRTPLTAVLGFSRLIEKQAGLPEEALLHIGRVLNAGEALMFTINDLLDFSKLEAGQVEIRPRPTSPVALVHEAADLLAVQATEKRIALDVEVQPGVPPSIVADPERVRQVLLNLVGNALKFTDQGRVLVRLRRADSGAALEFSVSDTGSGMTPAAVDGLFQRFAQVDGGQTGERRGTGLGLAICKGLVEAMGGVIAVESKLGVGSCFWFTLPLQISDETIPAPTLEDETALMAGCRVLVVDDNPANRMLVRSILTTFGVLVTEACDGVEAVAMAGQGDFDVVLMDLRMPGLDGESAARRIRAEGGLRASAPILAFSADRDIDLQDGLFLSAVAKPIDPEALLLAVARGCRQPVIA